MLDLPRSHIEIILTFVRAKILICWLGNPEKKRDKLIKKIVKKNKKFKNKKMRNLNELLKPIVIWRAALVVCVIVMVIGRFIVLV